tara:strand:+ start:1934 stop:2128 length:195 start_codon:yes stop_codon:yes gene_type:complete
MRLTQKETMILLTLLDTQVCSIGEEEIRQDIEDDNCFGVESWEQVMKLNKKLWKKHHQLNKGVA